MPRVLWREKKIISIETRKGVFVLAQMLKSPYLMFFDIFREVCEWDDVKPAELSSFFCCAVTRQFISSSNVKQQKLNPVEFDELPRRWIQTDSKSGFVLAWEGTKHEKKIYVIGVRGGALIDRDIRKGGSQDKTVIQQRIEFEDNETIDNHELTGIEVFPLLNERLYLCYLLRQVVDPYKELIFKRPLPLEYERYFDLMLPKKERKHPILPAEYGVEASN